MAADRLEAVTWRFGAGSLPENVNRRRQREGRVELGVDPAGPVDYLAIFLGELLDAEDGDDVLQIAVALEDLLDLPRNPVVLLADDQRIEDPGGRGKRVDRRVDTAL